MITRTLPAAGLRSWARDAMSPGAVTLCIGLPICAKPVGQDEQGNAERRVRCVGLRPPMLWLMGDARRQHE